MSHKLRRFACPHCGAERETLEDALHVMCRYCGDWIGADMEGFVAGAGYGEQLARTQDALRPGTGAARLAHLSLQMEAVARKGDRQAWRAMSEEAHALTALLHPELIPGVSEPGRRREWLVSSVAMAEITAFDPAVAVLEHARMQATATLSRSRQPVQDGLRLLEATQSYLRAVADHPGYATAPPIHVEHQAREMVRMSVTLMAVTLGGAQVQQVIQALFTDRELTRCPRCGADLSAKKGASACTYCGAVLRVQQEDPWLTQIRAVWQGTRARMAEPGHQLLGALSLIFNLPGKPTEDSALLFAHEVCASLDAADFAAGMKLARIIYVDPTQVRLLDALKSGAR